ncbi:HlyD family type I secretion periplasmic adaptor subunit [Desulfovibrionales bacterium]
MSALTPEEQKILDSNPRPIIVAGLTLIVVFFGGLLAWSAFLPIHGAVVAPGTVKVLQNKKVVQHLEGGIIDKILVREGDEVKAGQVLVQLRDERVEASVALNQGHLWAKIALAARLQAESRLDNAVAWPQEMLDAADDPEVADVRAKEDAVFTSRLRDKQGKISLYKAQIEQLHKQAEGAQAELTAQNDIIQSLKSEILAKQGLLKDKYIDKAQILELERRLATSEGRAGSLQQSIAENKQRIEEFKLRIVDLDNSYRQAAITELSRVTDEIFQLREQLRPIRDSQKRLDIVAPVDGIVLNLMFHSENSAVIRPGEPIMDIVPKDSKLIIEARITPTDIAKVYKGQPSEIMLPAFDRRTTPRFAGEVDYVSADQLVQQTSMGHMPFYIVHLTVDEQALKDAEAYLYPGMPAECYLTTKERTILSYLLEPFLKVMDKALRES